MKFHRRIWSLILAIGIVTNSLFLVGCSQNSKVILEKTPLYRASTELLMLSDDYISLHPVIEETELYVVDQDGNEYYLSQEGYGLALYKNDKCIYEFDNVANPSSARLFGANSGFDSLVLFVDDYLFRYEDSAWICIVSLQECAISYFYETNSMSFEDGSIVLYGKSGVGSFSEEGLFRLLLDDINDIYTSLSIVSIGFQANDVYVRWLNDVILYFNINNADYRVNITNYESVDNQFLMDAINGDIYDLVIFSEDYYSMLNDADYLTELDFGRINSESLNANVLNACDDNWITPFYKLQCLECSTNDGLIGLENFEYMDLINANGHIVLGDNELSLFNLILPTVNNESFALDAIEDILAFCEEYSQLGSVEYGFMYGEISEGRIRFINENIGSIYQYITLSEYFGEGMSLVDIGSEENVRYRSDIFIGVPSNINCVNNQNRIDGIYSFINTCVSYEGQSIYPQLLTETLPINTETMNAILCSIENAYANGFYADEPVTLFNTNVSFDFRVFTNYEMENEAANIDNIIDFMQSGDTELYTISDTQIRYHHDNLDDVIVEFNMYVNSGNEFYIENHEITSIILSEAQYYFDGEYTLEHAAELIVDRVNTYLAEVDC